MPELPEVETIRRDLTRYISGRVINQVTVALPKFVSPRRGFEQKLAKRRFVAVRRYGKLLVFTLDSDLVLHVHLKMTGQIVLHHGKKIIFGGHPISGLTALPNKYTRLTLYLSGGDILYVNDVRQFGYARIYTGKESKKLLVTYGLEPLTPAFTFSAFQGLLHRHPGATLKAFLLNQSFVAGLGNIYVDESCFRAGVRPGRKVGTLSLPERRRLYSGIRQILKMAVRHRGTTTSTYEETPASSAGTFGRYLNVYGRGGASCRRCGRQLVGTRLHGRGTVYCLGCQA